MHSLVIYIREAHPSDGWQVLQNKRDMLEINDPKTFEERRRVAQDFAERFELKLPVLIDDLDDRVNRAYAAWPDRLYVVDAKGKLAYVGKPGPRGFSVGDLPPVLERLLKQ